MNRDQLLAKLGQQLVDNLSAKVLRGLSDERRGVAVLGAMDFVGQAAAQGMDLTGASELWFQWGQTVPLANPANGHPPEEQPIVIFLLLLTELELLQFMPTRTAILVHPSASLAKYLGDVSVAVLRSLPADAFVGFDGIDGRDFIGGQGSPTFANDLLRQIGKPRNKAKLLAFAEFSCVLLDAMSLKLFGKVADDGLLHFVHSRGVMWYCKTSDGHTANYPAPASIIHELLLRSEEVGLIGQLTVNDNEFVISDFDELYALAERSLPMHILRATDESVRGGSDDNDGDE